MRGPLARRWMPLLTLVSCLMPLAAGAVPPTAGASSPAEARAWLARMHLAASAGNYRGTMVYSVDGTMSSSRVGHYTVGDQVYEVLESLDGRLQRIVRHNDVVHMLWPQSRLAVVETRQTLAAWSTTPQEVSLSALEQYEFRPEGAGRVAGREAQVILLEPRDTLRYAQRLWADRATGLMLRADVMGAPAVAGDTRPVDARPVLESTAFSEIAVGVKPQPDVVQGEMRRRLDGWRIVRPQQERTVLDAEGWSLVRPVPGFGLSGCVRRVMDAAGEAAEPVLQTVFTDGLTHVSLFIEPYRPHRHRVPARASRGATSTLTHRRGDHWLTVVGDVPPQTLELFLAAVERRPP